MCSGTVLYEFVCTVRCYIAAAVRCPCNFSSSIFALKNRRKCCNQTFSDFSSNFFCLKTWRKCWNQVFSNFSSNFFALKTWRKCWNQVYSDFSSNFFASKSWNRFSMVPAARFSGCMRKVFPWLPRKKNYSASAFIASVRTFISVSKSLRARHSLAWWHWSSCQGVWTPKAIVPGMCLAYVPPPIAIGSVNCSR